MSSDTECPAVLQAQSHAMTEILRGSPSREKTRSRIKFQLRRPLEVSTDIAKTTLQELEAAVDAVMRGLFPGVSNESLYQKAEMFCKLSPTSPRDLFLSVFRVICRHIRQTMLIIRKEYHFLRSLTPYVGAGGEIMFGAVGNLAKVSSMFTRLLEILNEVPIMSYPEELRAILSPFDDVARMPLNQLPFQQYKGSKGDGATTEQSEERMEGAVQLTATQSNMMSGLSPGQRRAAAYLPSVSRLIWIQLVIRHLTDLFDRAASQLTAFLAPLDVALVKLDAEALMQCLEILIDDGVQFTAAATDSDDMTSGPQSDVPKRPQEQLLSEVAESAIRVALPTLIRNGISRTREETSAYVSGRAPIALPFSLASGTTGGDAGEGTLAFGPVGARPALAGSISNGSFVRGAILDLTRTFFASDIGAENPYAAPSNHLSRRLKPISRASPMLVATLHAYSYHTSLERLSAELAYYQEILTSSFPTSDSIDHSASVTSLGILLGISQRMYEPCILKQPTLLAAFDNLSTTMAQRPPDAYQARYGDQAMFEWRLINRAQLRMRIRFTTDLFISLGMHKSHLVPTAVASAAAFYGILASFELAPQNQKSKFPQVRQHVVPRWIARLAAQPHYNLGSIESSNSVESSSSSSSAVSSELPRGGPGTFVAELAQPSAFAAYITQASRRLTREVAACEATPGSVTIVIRNAMAERKLQARTSEYMSEPIEVRFDPASPRVDLEYLRADALHNNRLTEDPSLSQATGVRALQSAQRLSDELVENNSDEALELSDDSNGSDDVVCAQAPLLHDTLRTPLADAIEHELISAQLSVLLEAGAPILFATCNLGPLRVIFDVALRLNLLAELQGAFAAYLIVCTKTIMAPYVNMSTQPLTSSSSSSEPGVSKSSQLTSMSARALLDIPADIAAVESLIALEDGALLVLAGSFHAYSALRQTVIRTAERSIEDVSPQLSDMIVSYLHRILTGYNPLCDPSSLLYSPAHFLPELTDNPQLSTELVNADPTLGQYAFPLFKDTSFSAALTAAKERQPLTEDELRTHLAAIVANKTSGVVVPRLHVAQFVLVVSRVLSLFRRISGRDLFQTISHAALGMRLLRLDAIHWIGLYASDVAEASKDATGVSDDQLLKYAVPLAESRGTNYHYSGSASVDYGDLWSPVAATPLSWEAIVLKAIGRECGHTFTTKHRAMLDDIQRCRNTLKLQLRRRDSVSGTSSTSSSSSTSTVDDSDAMTAQPQRSAQGGQVEQYIPRLDSPALRPHVPASFANHPLALSLTVLTAGQWPKLDVASPLPEPHPDVAMLLKAVATDYATHHDGRRLVFVHSQGCAVLKPHPNLFHNLPSDCEIIATGAQAAVLALFSDATQRISETEIIRSAKFPSASELAPTLRCLTAGADTSANILVMHEDSTYSLNVDYEPPRGATSNSGRIIRLPRSVEAASSQTAAATKSLFIEREHVVEAAIVRILKRKKVMDHATLVQTLNDLLPFQVPSGMLKARLERLIKHEFIERDPDDRNLYRYI